MNNVKQAMSTEIITIEAEETLAKAGELMRENDIGFLPVVESEQLVGVVTDRDLVIRGLAEELGPEEIVATVMTDECIAVEPNTSLEDAIEIMAEHQIRRLCVIEGDEIIGICAIGDIATYSSLISNTGEALSEISAPSAKRSIRVK